MHSWAACRTPVSSGEGQNVADREVQSGGFRFWLGGLLWDVPEGTHRTKLKTLQREDPVFFWLGGPCPAEQEGIGGLRTQLNLKS